MKVECTLSGTIDKLITILKDVDGNLKWVYGTKRAKLMKTISSNEFVYYAETSLPWPVKNRDAVIDMLFNNGSSNETLTVKATDIKGEMENTIGAVRIPYFNGLWQVSTVDKTHININYVLTIDPGGSMPAWAYNKFAAKGPYNTFIKLAELLKTR